MVARAMLSLLLFLVPFLEITTSYRGSMLAVNWPGHSQAMLMAMLVLWMLHQAQADLL